jgi:hypothetical protein
MEILNQRLTLVGKGFYHSLDTARHAYPLAYSYQYNDQKRLFVEQRTDYDPNQPLESSWDFNAAFTSMLVCQDARSEYRFVDVLYVKTAKDVSLVEKLAADFAEKYKDHCKKVLHIYGDNGAKKGDAGRNKTYFQQIKDVLNKAGWTIIDCVQASYPPYSVRYRVINSLLQESNVRLPKIRINETVCKALLISLQNAPVDGTSFEKIKKSEGDKTLPQEWATHLSDCFDYILFKKFSAYVTGSGTRAGGIIIR